MSERDPLPEIWKQAPPTLEQVARAVLLFYTVGPWDEGKQTEWWNLTQSNEATTRLLAGMSRAALAALAPLEPAAGEGGKATSER